MFALRSPRGGRQYTSSRPQCRAPPLRRERGGKATSRGDFPFSSFAHTSPSGRRACHDFPLTPTPPGGAPRTVSLPRGVTGNLLAHPCTRRAARGVWSAFARWAILSFRPNSGGSPAGVSLPPTILSPERAAPSRSPALSPPRALDSSAQSWYTALPGRRGGGAFHGGRRGEICGVALIAAAGRASAQSSPREIVTKFRL